MPFGAQLVESKSAKTMIALGGGIGVLCTVAASFVPCHSFILFYVLLSGGLGICNGLSYTVPIRLGWKAMPERSGLVSGLIIAGFGFGSLLFTSLSTSIVNPNNVSQEVVGKTENGEDILAFPESVTIMVPYLLRYLAMSFAAIIILAMILIREPYDITDKVEESIEDYFEKNSAQ